jgi:hypothetical protein
VGLVDLYDRGNVHRLSHQLVVNAARLSLHLDSPTLSGRFVWLHGLGTASRSWRMAIQYQIHGVATSAVPVSSAFSHLRIGQQSITERPFTWGFILEIQKKIFENRSVAIYERH